MEGEEWTEQETALYDRRIRVWGGDAQRRLSKASILVCGITGTVPEDEVAIPWRKLPRKVSKPYFAMRVMEKFEETEGRNPEDVAVADLPGVVKLKRALRDAEEVIKGISGKGDPLKNFFFFDAFDGKGVIEDISFSDPGN